jgi:OOP family OmpA-OmpF porin
MRWIPLFLLLVPSVAVSQNLVPNPSFEAVSDTIGHFTEDHLEFMRKTKYWSTPNTASPDLITPDFEERYIRPPAPHTGSVMVGIQSKETWSEYIGIKLPQALLPNRTYQVSYWIRRAVCINPAMNKDQVMNEYFGILFSSDPYVSSEGAMMVGTPQISVDTPLWITDTAWVQIRGFFTPETECSRLYLGQFRKEGDDPPNMGGYYVIDDISVEEVAGFASLNGNEQLPVGSIIPLNNVQFKSGTTELSDSKSADLLEKLATYLLAQSAIRIRINGHTDAQGSDRSNLSLSKKRAKFIAQTLVQLGIPNDRIEWKGFGEGQPIADNETAEGRAKNRRVEFEVIE